MQRPELVDYKKARITALFGAMLLHSGMAAWAMQPDAPVALPQQVIQVSLVAVSTPDQQKVEKTVEEVVEAPKLPPKPDGIKKVEPKKEKVEKKEQKEAKLNSVARETIGQQSPDATELKSAKTEAIFDAAYLRNPVPNYPDSARRRGIQGKVLLNVLVTTEGTAADVSIARSSGNGALDEAALNAVRRWHFVPARRGSQLVSDNVLVPIDFKLN